MLLNQQTDPSNVESVKNALKNRKTWHSFSIYCKKLYLIKRLHGGKLCISNVSMLHENVHKWHLKYENDKYFIQYIKNKNKNLL